MNMRQLTGVAVLGAIMAAVCSCTDHAVLPDMLKAEMAVAYAPPTQEQKAWALATCALLTQVNQRQHDLLGGCAKTPQNSEIEQKLLDQWWGVHDPKSLQAILTWLECKGHRTSFDEITKMVATATPEQLARIKNKIQNNPSASNKLALVERWGKGFGTKSILAWDYDRFVAVCGWAYVAGYISEDDAWRRIMPVARVLQKTFRSWEELGQNHIVGREFWSLKQTQQNGQETRDAYSALTTNPNSPWMRIPWNLSLDPPKEQDKPAR